MRESALSLMSSGGFLKRTFTVSTEEMSTAASPTIPSSHLTSEQLTVLAASFSSLVFFVIIVVLLSIIYRKDPQCCKLHSYQGPRADMDAPPQYYSSRQTLVGSPCLEQSQIMDDNNTQQAGQLFYVGLPSSYSLPTLEAPLPRLPSYESVRKKDRQRQIHMMIADRFGLNGPIVTEQEIYYNIWFVDLTGVSSPEVDSDRQLVHPITCQVLSEGACHSFHGRLPRWLCVTNHLPPPTYEESIRQSMELPYNILSPSLDIYTTEPDAPHPVSSDTNSAVLTV